MKRAFSLLLALALLACGASAMADWQYPTAEGTWIMGSKPVSIDLDGDGTAEAVSCAMIPDEYEAHLQLKVANAGGDETVYDTGIIDGNPAWAYDFDGDGALELFAWGDVMSDDYVTWCLHYVHGRLVPVLFADTTRGGGVGGYFKDGYGMLSDVDIEAGTVTLVGSQDVLGTYFMARTLKLSEDGLFEFADDGLWVRELLDEDDMWETYGVLTAKATVPCEIGGEPAELEPGTRLMITASDKASVADFITQDGREGTLAIETDYTRGWGWTVSGLADEDLFEMIPYAD